MVSYGDTLGTSWVQISNDEDYMLQNKSTNGTKVLVKVSASEPTDTVGAFELNGGDVVASTVLNGVVWAKAVGTGLATIAYAK